MKTLHGGTPGAPQAFVQPALPQNWYWPLDATMYDGKIQWLLGELGSSGSGGAWDFAYRGFDLAILDPGTLAIESMVNVIQSPEISYGSCLLEDDDFVYIYGIKTKGLSKTVHLARAPGGNLQNHWTFFDGISWSEKPSDFVIAKNVSDQFSVIKEGGIYYLITHEPYFSRRIQIMQSDNPAGPWSNRRTLFCTPENTDNIFTYNSFVHPELSEAGELRISYNINSFNFNDLFMNADLYRPKFIRIDQLAIVVFMRIDLIFFLMALLMASGSCGTPQKATLTSLNYRVETADDWSQLFIRDQGWFGGDGIFAIPMSRVDTNKQMIIFSDTMLGLIKDGVLQKGYHMVNNSVVFLEGKKPVESQISFPVPVDSLGNDRSIFPAKLEGGEEGEYFWLGDGFLNPVSEDIHLFAYRVADRPESTEQFKFEVLGGAIITLPAG